MGLDLRGSDPPPSALPAVERAAARLGFTMSCTRETGALLAFLAALHDSGRILELGTGVGYGTAWLLSGMGPAGSLTTIEADGDALAAARNAIGDDHRVAWLHADAASWLLGTNPDGANSDDPYDVIFADCWPGKFTHLDETLGKLSRNGIYVIDDLEPQPSWPPGHQPHVDALLGRLRDHPRVRILTLPVATGVLIATPR